MEGKFGKEVTTQKFVIEYGAELCVGINLLDGLR